MSASFSGSYPEGDVTFLLRRLQMERTPLHERERLIQSGQNHYSEMIGPEDAPSRARLKLFRRCLEANGQRLAGDLSLLAAGLAASAVNGCVTLVSIARAGTPIGVLLQRRIQQTHPALLVKHYSISVIRDRGVDAAAVHEILKQHPAETLRFIDGWTGKGTIANELTHSISADTSLPPALSSGLWVPLDVCGAAEWAASCTDYVIPASLLGGTISGLVSRSVLSKEAAAQGLMHGCVPLPHLKKYDLSNWFIRHMMTLLESIPSPMGVENCSGGPTRWLATKAFLREAHEMTGIKDPNRIKLGIGETVRVLLRRLPQEIWLNPVAPAEDIAIVRQLAQIRQVPLQIRPGIPFAAVAIIADALDS